MSDFYGSLPGKGFTPFGTIVDITPTPRSRRVDERGRGGIQPARDAEDSHLRRRV